MTILKKVYYYLIVQRKENVMNVQFADDEKMETLLAKESFSQLKNNIPSGKKLYFIFDMDRNDVFFSLYLK